MLVLREKKLGGRRTYVAGANIFEFEMIKKKKLGEPNPWVSYNYNNF